MRVFSTLVSWSNENKSYMRVDKQEFACIGVNSRILVKQTQELHEI